ncbi:MAG: DUF3300 domain-containing protein [Wenzhouxiangella sp.]|nr:DUF3300 domain-containing protein [Wenzhouxiangella sp.]
MKYCNAIVLSLLLSLGLLSTSPVRSADVLFSQAELDQMLAPVALYPDTVLSHVLIAATYPLEVIQAARWSRANPDLLGEEAVAAVEQMNWDPSVMALVAFPGLLARMDEDIEWTHRLGDAFLVQEDQVVATIQQLRGRAYAAGNLQTNEHVRVVREREYIYIEPARTRVVYVPFYDPWVVYGSWWWVDHPPVIWHHPPRFRHRPGVVFYWGPAYRVAPTFYFSAFHWPRRQVVVVHHHHHHHHHHRGRKHFSSGRSVASYGGARHWQHDPVHRRGVSYTRPVPDQRLVERSRQSAAPPSQQATQASSVRSAQARGEQRDWAARQRAERGLEPVSERTAARSQLASDRVATSGRVGSVRQQPAERAVGRDARISRNTTQSGSQAPQRERVPAGSATADRQRALTDRLGQRPDHASQTRSGGAVQRGADRSSSGLRRAEAGGTAPDRSAQQRQRLAAERTAPAPSPQVRNQARIRPEQGGSSQAVTQRPAQPLRSSAVSPQARREQATAAPGRQTAVQPRPAAQPRATQSTNRQPTATPPVAAGRSPATTQPSRAQSPAASTSQRAAVRAQRGESPSRQQRER